MNQVTWMMSPPPLRFQDFAAALLTHSVILTDHKRSITWASPAALRLHGIDRAERLGATVSEYIANFRIDYDAPRDPALHQGASRHVGLCEGPVVLFRSSDDAVPLRCQMQLFEMRDANTDACNTAIILHPAETWPEISGVCADGPEGESFGRPIRWRSITRVLETSHAARAAESNGMWSAARPADTAASSKQDDVAVVTTTFAADSVALHVLDAEMRVLRVSDMWLAWLGYDAASVVGLDIGLFVDAETRLRFQRQAAARPRSASRANILCRFRKRSGEPVEVMVEMRADEIEAGELSYTCTLAGVADCAQDDDLLRLIAMSPVATLCWQLDNLTVREANQAAYDLTGHAVGTLAGQNLDNLGLCETKAARQKLEQELRVSGSVHGQDVRVRTSTGEMLTCVLSAALIRLAGQVCGVMQLQDVTERRRDEAQLFDAIEAVMKDSAWFSRTVIEKLAMLRSPPKTSGRQAELADLTRREREVLTLISVGQCDLDIARQLGLTRSTVRNHVATLYSKIDVHSRSAAIVWARERGINLTMTRMVPRQTGRRAPV